MMSNQNHTPLLQNAANWLKTKDESNIRYAYQALIQPLQNITEQVVLAEHNALTDESSLYNELFKIVVESDHYNRKLTVWKQGWTAKSFKSTLDGLCENVRRLIFNLEEPSTVGEALIVAYHSFLKKTADGSATKLEKDLATIVGMNIPQQRECANQTMSDIEYKFQGLFAPQQPVQEEIVRIEEITVQQLLEEDNGILNVVQTMPARIKQLEENSKILIEQYRTIFSMLAAIERRDKEQLQSWVNTDNYMQLASRLLRHLDAVYNNQASYISYILEVIANILEVIAKFSGGERSVADSLFAYQECPSIIEQTSKKIYASFQKKQEQIDEEIKKITEQEQLKMQKISQLKHSDCITTFQMALHACLATGFYGWLWKLISNEYRTLQAHLQQALELLQDFSDTGNLNDLVELKRGLEKCICTQHNVVLYNSLSRLSLKKIKEAAFPLESQKKFVMNCTASFFSTRLQLAQSASAVQDNTPVILSPV